MRVLLVEDEARIASFVVKGLDRNGCTVDWVTTGAEALVRADAGERPDVVILDLGLPDIDGLDVLRALRQRGLSTPVVVLTARSHPQDRSTAWSLGVRDYLTKPVAMAALLERLGIPPSPPNGG